MRKTFKARGEKKRPTSCKQINWLAPSNLLIRSFLDQKIKTLLRNGTFCLEIGSKNIQIHKQLSKERPLAVLNWVEIRKCWLVLRMTEFCWSRRFLSITDRPLSQGEGQYQWPWTPPFAWRDCNNFQRQEQVVSHVERCFWKKYLYK